MRSSETLANLAGAMVTAMSEMQNASKDRQAYGYRYADLAQVLDIARPVLARHQLAIVQAPATSDAGISVTTRLLHASGEWLEETLTLPVEAAKNLSQAQAAGAVISYARRYALAAMLAIAQEDSDAAKPAAVAPKSTISAKTIQAIEAGLTAAQMDADRLCEAYGVAAIADLDDEQAASALKRLAERAKKLATKAVAA